MKQITNKKKFNLAIRVQSTPAPYIKDELYYVRVYLKEDLVLYYNDVPVRYAAYKNGVILGYGFTIKSIKLK